MSRADGMGIVYRAAVLILTGVVFLPGVARSQEEDSSRGRALVNSHAQTNFPLMGKHRSLECSACHLDGVIEGTPLTCEACHWARTQDDPYRLHLGTHCQDCHTPQAWKKLVTFSWSHEKTSGFRLEGAHRAVDCTRCHDDGRFGLAEARCESCHAQDYLAAREPDHAAAKFPMTCDACHLPSHRSWAQAVFSHPFPIDSRPHRLPCSDCHHSDNLREFSCIDCHAHSLANANRYHARVAGFIYASVACYGCHPTGHWP